jgi:tetratricopeptide (TPR) repeat protein
VYRPIPADTLYSLLVAEVAGQRQRFDISLYHYMTQARKTQDPEISERAARIAQYVGSAELAEEALAIWLQQQPDDPAAHQAAAQLAMDAGDFALALDHMQRLYQLAGISQFDYLAANAARLKIEQKQTLLAALAQLNDQYPDNANLYQARAILEQQLGRYDQALHNNDRAIRLDEDFLAARIQRARLLAQMDRSDDAIDWLEDLENDYPQQKSIAVLRARLLLKQRRMQDALLAFVRLHENFPGDMAILLSLALLEEEIGQPQQAQQHLQQLLNNGAHENEAHFYLGKIAEEQQQPELALTHYQQVTSGREFLAAQLNAAQLLNDTQGLDAARRYLDERRAQYPQQTSPLTRIEVELLASADRQHDAMALLNQALAIESDDHDLLYTRAMLAEQLDDLALLERDLRHLIQLKPDHAEALNALGYTLADRTDRWQEALPLVEKALALSPNNPAIIDSLGWIYFRAGQLDKALPLLQQAYELMVDHEIAAHYGELLWITGEKQRALDIWEEGLESNPDSDIIPETMQRLNASPQ